MRIIFGIKTAPYDVIKKPTIWPFQWIVERDVHYQTQTSISVARTRYQCLTLTTHALWWSWMAVFPDSTLQMMMLANLGRRTSIQKETSTWQKFWTVALFWHHQLRLWPMAGSTPRPQGVNRNLNHCFHSSTVIKCKHITSTYVLFARDLRTLVSASSADLKSITMNLIRQTESTSTTNKTSTHTVYKCHMTCQRPTKSTKNINTGCSGLVVACLTAAQEVHGSNHAADKIFCVFHENQCDMQLWAWAAYLLQCLSRLSLPPSEGR